MGTDKWPRKPIPCKCGKGYFEVIHCEPDHDYVRDHQIWFEGNINCPECSEKYEIGSISDKRIIIITNKETKQSERVFEKECKIP
jgi:hypothetical protein